MAADNRFFDDLARMAGGAASLVSTVRRQIRSDLKDRVGAYTSKMDLAGRDEIERLQAMVTKYRVEQDQMKRQIAELEAALGGKAKPAAPKKKPASSKSAKKSAGRK